MIHVVTSENRHLYGLQLRTMHEQRRRQCAEGNGRAGLVVLDGDEIDDADDGRAIDLLGFDEAMTLEVGLRLRPTDERCRLADRFPHLIAPDESPKKGQDIWEASHLFTTRACHRRKGDRRGERVFEAWAAAMELGLSHGVSRFVGMIDMQLYPGVLNSPIDIRLVGPPCPHGHGVVAGLEIVLSRTRLNRLLEALGREGSIGYHVDALDLIAFGDLRAVQQQVRRAMTPQLPAGARRDETLAADTLFRLYDRSRQARKIPAGRERTLPRALLA